MAIAYPPGNSLYLPKGSLKGGARDQECLGKIPSHGDQTDVEKKFSSRSIDPMKLSQGAVRRNRQAYSVITQMSHGPAFLSSFIRGNASRFMTISKLPVVSGSVRQVII